MKTYIFVGGIFMSLMILVGATGYGFMQYVRVDQTLGYVRDASEAEDYDHALSLLRSVRNNIAPRVIRNQSVLIDSYFLQITARKSQKSTYDEALSKLSANQNAMAMAIFDSIPPESFYYDRSMAVLEQTKRELSEQALGNAVMELEETADELAKSRIDIDDMKIQISSLQSDLKKALEERSVAQDEKRLVEREAVLERMAKEKAEFDSAILQDKVESGDRALVLEMAETHPQIKAIVNGRLDVYFDPLPSYADPSIAPVVTNVMEAFSTAHLYGASVNRVYNPGSADIHVKWIRDYGSHTLGMAIFKSVLEIGLGSTNCVDDWVPFDANTVTKVMWHELGHSLGYGHSSAPSNIMYPTTSTQYIYEQSISDVLAQNWYITFPLCGAGPYYYNFETSDVGSAGFDIYVLPPGEDAKGISSGNARVYSGCGAQGMIRFNGECNVSIGSKVYVSNNDYYSAIRISGTIINTGESDWPDMTWDESAFEYDSGELDNYWRMFN
tara:strand:+ start:221 stop:1717 length:1497 start_codon:yes stop_codon:yes gene_type:complete